MVGAGLQAVSALGDSPAVSRLVAAARAGDRVAFGELITLHDGLVYRTALAALGRREDAEDAAQDAFVVAWRKLAGFRGDAAFRTWLLRIVWRKALDRRRKRSLSWARMISPGAPEQDHRRFEVADETADPERAAVARDALDRAQRQIQALSPRLRDTLLLAASGEHTYDEIGAMLGIPTGTVKWRVAEARRLVKRALDLS
jgi:RNA polymerase sigma-70 factor (ECF subfamily)